MGHQAPTHTFPYGRPKDVDGSDTQTEGAMWIDDGSTTGADDDDLCYIRGGQIHVVKPASSTPV